MSEAKEQANLRINVILKEYDSIKISIVTNCTAANI
jgi:hypothetical protein